MLSIYRKTWVCLRGNPGVMLSFLAMLVAISILGVWHGHKGIVGAQIVTQLVIARSVTRHFLTGQRLVEAIDLRQHRMLALLSTGALLTLPPMFGAMVVVTKWLPELFSVPYRNLFVLFYIVITCIVMVPWIAVTGTALPSIVAGEAFTLIRPFQRARRTAGPILWGLMIAPVPVAIVLCTLVFALWTVQGRLAPSLSSLADDVLTGVEMNAILLVVMTIGCAVLAEAWQRLADQEKAMPPAFTQRPA